MLRNPQTGRFRVQEVSGEPDGAFEQAMNQALIKKTKKKVTVDLALQSVALLALIVLAAWLGFTPDGGLEVVGAEGKDQSLKPGEVEPKVQCGTALKVWYAFYFLLACVRFYVALYSAARYRRFQRASPSPRDVESLLDAIRRIEAIKRRQILILNPILGAHLVLGNICYYKQDDLAKQTCSAISGRYSLLNNQVFTYIVIGYVQLVYYWVRWSTTFKRPTEQMDRDAKLAQRLQEQRAAMDPHELQRYREYMERIEIHFNELASRPPRQTQREVLEEQAYNDRLRMASRQNQAARAAARAAGTQMPSKGQIKHYVDKQLKTIKYDYLTALAANIEEEASKFDPLDIDDIEEELKSKKNWSQKDNADEVEDFQEELDKQEDEEAQPDGTGNAQAAKVEVEVKHQMMECGICME